jgi:hypothetical protein
MLMCFVWRQALQQLNLSTRQQPEHAQRTMLMRRRHVSSAANRGLARPRISTSARLPRAQYSA